MLAWLHQATASEKEHLEALLKQVTLQGMMSKGTVDSSLSSPSSFLIWMILQSSRTLNISLFTFYNLLAA